MQDSVMLGLITQIHALKRVLIKSDTDALILNKSVLSSKKQYKNNNLNNKEMSSKNNFHVLTLTLALEALKKQQDCNFSSALYPLLLSKGKVIAYDSAEVIEMRRKKSIELRKDKKFLKLSENNPEYFKKQLIRMHVQSKLVNDYINKFESVEEIINDLK